jgi:hypothetical protein
MTPTTHPGKPRRDREPRPRCATLCELLGSAPEHGPRGSARTESFTHLLASRFGVNDALPCFLRGSRVFESDLGPFDPEVARDSDRAVAEVARLRAGTG